MFIDKVRNPRNSDRWYSKQDRTLDPRENIVTSGYSYKDIYEHFFKLGRYPTRKDSFEKMIAGFNPKYKPNDAKFVRGISAILAVKYYGMEPILNDTLLRLDL